MPCENARPRATSRYNEAGSRPERKPARVLPFGPSDAHPMRRPLLGLPMFEFFLFALMGVAALMALIAQAIRSLL